MELYDRILRGDYPENLLKNCIHQLTYERNFCQKRMVGLLMTMQLGEIDHYHDELLAIEQKMEKLEMCIALYQSRKHNKLIYKNDKT